MAVDLMPEHLGEAILEFLGRFRPDLGIRARELLEYVQEVAEPPPGVVLTAADGARFTGILLVDRNQPVMMLAIRHPGDAPSRPCPAPVARAPYVNPYALERDDPWGLNSR